MKVKREGTSCYGAPALRRVSIHTDGPVGAPASSRHLFGVRCRLEAGAPSPPVLTKNRTETKSTSRARNPRRAPQLRVRTGLRAGWWSLTFSTWLVWRGGW